MVAVLAADERSATLKRATQAIGGTEFITAQFGVAAAFLAIGFGFFLYVINALAAAWESKSDAVIRLMRGFGAGAGRDGQRK